jgi:chromosome segregation ATPase
LIGRLLAFIFANAGKLITRITSAWSAQMRALDARNKELQNVNAVLQADIKLMRERADALHRENATLRAEKGELETRHNDLSAFVEGLQIELNDAKKRIAELSDADVVRTPL